jgi:translation initiation factor 2 alpha subunit (eIF-2alpha)
MSETFAKATRNMNIFKYPWYKNKYPKVDQIVICKAKKIEEIGITFEILDYLGIQAFMPLNELSRKKVRSIRSIFKEGDIKPLLVLRIDEENGYIDLSNKYVDMVKDDILRLDKYSSLIYIFYKWCLYLENKDKSEFDQNISIEIWNKILESTLWAYQTSEIYDNIMKIRTNENTILDIFPNISNYDKNDLLKLNKIIIESISFEININIKIKIVCWAINPILYIQNVCSNLSDKIKSYELDCNIKSSSPIYEFTIKTNKLEIVDEFFEKIDNEFSNILKEATDLDFKIEKEMQKIE